MTRQRFRMNFANVTSLTKPSPDFRETILLPLALQLRHLPIVSEPTKIKKCSTVFLIAYTCHEPIRMDLFYPSYYDGVSVRRGIRKVFMSSLITIFILCYYSTSIRSPRSHWGSRRNEHNQHNLEKVGSRSIHS